jgi:hypothetical protein
LVGAQAVAHSEPGEEDEDTQHDAFLGSHPRTVGQVVGLEQHQQQDEDREQEGVVVFSVEDEVEGERAERQGIPHLCYLISNIHITLDIHRLMICKKNHCSRPSSSLKFITDRLMFFLNQCSGALKICILFIW